jgi:damage-control phosphatase, subfamily I
MLPPSTTRTRRLPPLPVAPLNPYPQCSDCLSGLAREASRMAAGQDERLRSRAEAEALKTLEAILPTGLSSPEVANRVYRAIRRVSGNEDPYREAKKHEMQLAREASVYFLQRPPRDLKECISLAALGNSFDFFKEPEEALSQVADRQGLNIYFYHDDRDHLEKFLQEKPETILYLTDNSGEIFFDRPLYQQLNQYADRVILVVKGGPALNDLTREELSVAGLAEAFTEIMDTGTDGVGIELDRVSNQFRRALGQADLVFSKGMANFETLYPQPLPCPVFYLFRVKCNPMRDYLQAPPESFWALWKEKTG